MTRNLLALFGGATAIFVATAYSGDEFDATAMAAEAGATVTAAPSPTAARTDEEAFNSECGACHMAFPPPFLPARSWQAIMAGLDDHFGENASLDPDTQKQITDYLVANAAGPGSPVFRGIGPQDTPLRITETRLWRGIHHEIPDYVYDRPDIKSKSNCLACHGGGARVGDD